MRKVALPGLVVLAGLLFPTFAAGAQHPRTVPHKAAPFGSHSKAACGKPSTGRASCFALIETNASGAALTTALPSGYGPADFQTAYNITALSANGGKGETVAIVDAYDDPDAESDLAVYRSTYGLSPCTTANGCFEKVNQTGGSTPPPVDSTGGWELEESLDLDMVSAIAPNAHILLVEANDNTFVNLGTAVNEAASLGANVISNSYGAPESSAIIANFNAYYNHPGIAVVVSSGDHGWDDCWGTPNCATGPNFPASSQHVQAIGGTSLTSISPRTESAWGLANVWGAGSGCSNVVPKPSWQTDPGCTNRTVADVSADADPNTGAAVYDTYAPNTGWLIVGGTSESAPINGGYDALLGSTTGTPGWEYGKNIWNDVTTGSNGTCGTYICNAVLGYEGPTGLGTPNGSLAVPPPPTPTITSEPTNPTTSTSATFTFTDTDTTATFKCSLDGSAHSACTSPANYTGLTVGSHTFGVEAVDTGGTSSPTTYTWQINATSPPPPSPTITSKPSNPTTSTSATFTFTDTDTTATFKCSLDGSAYSACTSPANYTGLTVGSHTFGVEAVDTGGTSSPTTYTWTITAPANKCVVPRLYGDTLNQAKAALSKANCSLGRVTNILFRRTKVVILQNPPAGRTEPNGYRVDIWLI